MDAVVSFHGINRNGSLGVLRSSSVMVLCNYLQKLDLEKESYPTPSLQINMKIRMS